MTVSRIVVYGDSQVRAYDEDNKPISMFKGPYGSVKFALHHAIAGTDAKIVVAAKDEETNMRLHSRIARDYHRFITRRRNSRENIEQENKAVEEAAAVIPS